MQKKIQKDRGSVTVLVLSSILVILLVLVSIYVASNNRNRTDKETFRKIKEAYDMTEEEMQELYDKITTGKSERLNPPEMLDGMKKIMFTEPTEEKKGEIVQEGEADFDKEEWYSYKKGKWANAQTEDGSMWVWIPRFAYKIEEQPEYSGDVATSGGSIKIKFLIGDSDEYYADDGSKKTAKRENANSSEYRVHPAFTKETNSNYENGGGNKELTGIWVAKFEAGYAGGNNNAPIKESEQEYSKSTMTLGETEITATDDNSARNWLDGVYGANKTSIKYPTFQGVTYAMNYINTDDAFFISQGLTEEGNIYGLTDDANSHLMKNSEWGAVAYLSQSEYGSNKSSIYINNITLNSGKKARTSSKGQTGVESVYAVTGVTGGAQNGKEIEADIANINNTTANTASTEGVYTWNQKTGQEASSTGTIYGIYDLNGGLAEKVADYVANNNKALSENGTNYAKGESSQYVKAYTSGESSGNNNFSANSKIYGDAISETSKESGNTSSWFNDASIYPEGAEPFFTRGGKWSQGESAGVFNYEKSDGSGAYNLGFRAVLVAK